MTEGKSAYCSVSCTRRSRLFGEGQGVCLRQHPEVVEKSAQAALREANGGQSLPYRAVYNWRDDCNPGGCSSVVAVYLYPIQT